MAWRALGPGRVALVTDAIAALGLPQGPCSVGDTSVVVDSTGAIWSLHGGLDLLLTRLELLFGPAALWEMWRVY